MKQSIAIAIITFVPTAKVHGLHSQFHLLLPSISLLPQLSLSMHKLIALSTENHMPMIDKDLIVVVAVTEFLIVQCESTNTDKWKETSSDNATQCATGQEADPA